MVSDVVAIVGDQKISVSQFTERYKRFLENTGMKDNLVVRNNLLQTMVYEQLIIQDADHRGLLLAPEYRNEVEQIKIQSLLGAYFDVLSDTMSVSEDELKTTYVRMNTVVHARHLYSSTFAGALRLKNRLEKGESFNKIAVEIFSDSKLKYSGGDLGYFTGGDMETAFEDIAFTLPIGKTSDPVKTEDGYSIIKVESRVAKPLITEFEYASKKSRLEILVRTQKRVHMAAAYAKHLQQELKLLFSENIIQQLFAQWRISSSFDRLRVNEAIHSITHKQILTSTRNQWTVQDVLDRAYKVNPKQFRRVQNAEDLKELLSGLVVQEELIRRAAQKSLDTAASYRRRVSNDTTVEVIEAWSKETEERRLNFSEVSGTFRDRRTQKKFENQLHGIYKNNTTQYVYPEERNVAEIVVDSFSTAMMIMSKTNNRESFSTLAKKYSISRSSVHGGELGFSTRSFFGNLSDTVFSAQKENIIGPIQLEKKYAIFKILDIRKSRQKSFAEVKDEIADALLQEWKANAHKEELRSLLLNHTIEINKDILASISF